MTHFDPPDPQYLEKVRSSFQRQMAMQTIGAELLSVSPGEVAIKIPFREDLTQQHGFVHAGIISMIGDNACGYAAFSLMPADTAVLTVEFKVNLLSPARGDFFIAKAKVVRAGKTLIVARSEVFAELEAEQKLIAAIQATIMCIHKPNGLEN